MGIATGEPTFIVNLEVKENQGPVSCLGVGETVVLDTEGTGALQLKVTGLTAAVIQLLEGLQHRKTNMSEDHRVRGSTVVMGICAVGRGVSSCVRELEYVQEQNKLAWPRHLMHPAEGMLLGKGARVHERMCA